MEIQEFHFFQELLHPWYIYIYIYDIYDRPCVILLFTHIFETQVRKYLRATILHDFYKFYFPESSVSLFYETFSCESEEIQVPLKRWNRALCLIQMWFSFKNDGLNNKWYFLILKNTHFCICCLNIHISLNNAV